jgi:hypothetical protein
MLQQAASSCVHCACPVCTKTQGSTPGQRPLQQLAPPRQGNPHPLVVVLQPGRGSSAHAHQHKHRTTPACSSYASNPAPNTCAAPTTLDPAAMAAKQEPQVHGRTWPGGTDQQNELQLHVRQQLREPSMAAARALTAVTTSACWCLAPSMHPCVLAFQEPHRDVRCAALKRVLPLLPGTFWQQIPGVHPYNCCCACALAAPHSYTGVPLGRYSYLTGCCCSREVSSQSSPTSSGEGAGSGAGVGAGRCLTAAQSTPSNSGCAFN